MRRIVLSILGAVAGIVLWSDISALAANGADFQLINRTGYQIDEVYIRPHRSVKWGPDVLGQQALDESEVATITFPKDNTACHFDIKVKYQEDESTAEWSNVDLCKFSRITLYWDAKSQVTRAVGD